jgi:hypothetical protein
LNASQVMTRTAMRFERRADHVVEDTATGLEWDLQPAGSPADWLTAMAESRKDDWRLPSLTELTSLLTALPGDLCPGDPHEGVTVWTASESPFASASDARAVRWNGEGRFAVVVCEKAVAAAWWRVRLRSAR